MAKWNRAVVIGGGAIGASWAALFAAKGLQVMVNDPRPDSASDVKAFVERATPSLKKLGYTVKGLNDRIAFEPDLAKAVKDAEVVQESGPERLPIKQAIWQSVEKAAGPDALFLSSTAGIPSGRIATAMRDRTRLLVGHPFHPPHLLPLVEVVPNPKTNKKWVDLAAEFYRAMDRVPVVEPKEIQGFVGNRLQTALFREAVWLVQQGYICEHDLDTVVRNALGIRWAVAGPFLSFSLGADGGLGSFLDHFGSNLVRQWADLQTPELTPETVERLTKQSRQVLAGRSVGDLVRTRDEYTLAVLGALRGDNLG